MTTVLASGAALFLYFFLICILLRLTRQKNSLPVLVAAALIVFCASLVVFGDRISFWHFASYFGLGVMGVVFLYGLALKSLSLGMLSALTEAPNGVLTHDELTDVVVRPAFLERIDLLTERRMAEHSPEGYAATEAGADTAEKLLHWRGTLKLSASGLYGG